MEEILASIKRVIADDARPPAASTRSKGGSRAAPEPEPLPPPPEPEEDLRELIEPMKADDGHISEDVTAATRNTLATLAAMRQQPRHFEPQQPGEGPLEAVVREMLRPMLKEWLDTRLPEMVEDMVAREIARITGKSF